jgi:SAM-dependent methyltransferase
MKKQFWDDGGGFFGRWYIEGDDSVEGYLTTPMSLEERTAREIDGILRLVHPRSGAHILDCPCGYGRHCVPLAQFGFNVVGSDINGEMLNAAAQRAKNTSGVRFAQENMLNLTYQDTFDVVLNLFYSFGFFETDEENNRVLRNFYQALKPGGTFMMHTDVNIPRILKGEYKLHEKRKLRSGKQLEIVESYAHDERRMRGQWILIDTESTRHELTPYSHRVYTFEEFAQLCAETGFEDITGYGGWDGSPLSARSEDMIVIARKPA